MFFLLTVVLFLVYTVVLMVDVFEHITSGFHSSDETFSQRAAHQKIPARDPISLACRKKCHPHLLTFFMHDALSRLREREISKFLQESSGIRHLVVPLLHLSPCSPRLGAKIVTESVYVVYLQDVFFDLSSRSAPKISLSLSV